jgi:2-keto-myo-inositol isomerase
VAPPGLSLHTWTLDTTPLADVLRIARQTGWAAVELRAADFAREAEAGRSEAEVLDLVRASGLPVSAVGAQLGWMLAEGAERRRLFDSLADACRRAAALDCPTVMCPADHGAGDLSRAAASVREAGDVAAEHGVRLAIEAHCVAEWLNTLERLRELLAAAGHPACGLLVDTYHLDRSGGGPAEVAALAPGEILYAQFSDVPAEAGPPTPADLFDRLPAGRGRVPLADLFALLHERGYSGWLSYEAPNRSAWARAPEAVAREAYEAALRLPDGAGRPAAAPAGDGAGT